MTRAEFAEVARIIAAAKKLAVRYRELTGKPLGITSEVAEFEAARLLNLELCPARNPGCDLVGRGLKAGFLAQVKGRVLQDGAAGGRIGGIKFRHPWQVVLFVLMDARFEPIGIWSANRATLKAALERPGSKARNERGQLSLSQFKACAEKVWSATASSSSKRTRRPTTTGKSHI